MAVVEITCNFRNCHQPLRTFAWITSCEHAFCDEHGESEFANRPVSTPNGGAEKGPVTPACPVCRAPLTNRCDVVRANLDPPERFRSMALAGLRPRVVMDVAARAIAFWSRHVADEAARRAAAARAATDALRAAAERRALAADALRAELDAATQRARALRDELDERSALARRLQRELLERRGDASFDADASPGWTPGPDERPPKSVVERRHQRDDDDRDGDFVLRLKDEGKGANNRRAKRLHPKTFNFDFES